MEQTFESNLIFLIFSWNDDFRELTLYVGWIVDFPVVFHYCSRTSGLLPVFSIIVLGGVGSCRLSTYDL